MVELSQNDIGDLKAEGYTDQQIQDALKEVAVEEKTKMPMNQSFQSRFQYNPSDNLIKWQLEVNDILEKAEHILREDQVSIKNGELQWTNHPNPKQRIFTDYGVQEVLRCLSMYVNRNTILADYDPEEIKEKVFDFGIELNNLIFMKYEDFGLTTIEKRKNYPMLVRELIDMVHSTYTRAKYGRERDSLRTARQIAQTEQIMPANFNVNTGQTMKERGVVNPLRYIGSKYK